MTLDDVRTELLAMLAAQSNLQVWDGAPDDGQTSTGFRPGERDVALDGDGRAHAYAALYLGPGQRQVDSEADQGGPVVVTFQVTAAGGDPRRCLLASQKVLDALDEHRLTNGRMIRSEFDPGPPRVDREPSPSRYWVPLLFRVATD